MPKDLAKHVAGGGIEYAYMTSKDKCKEQYFARRKEDPDYKGKDGTERIFNRALEADMRWHGWIINEKRDRLLHHLRCLIDPSWNINFSKQGDHFNRVTTDAMIAGCIPIARNLGMSSNHHGTGVVFKPNTNYIMIPHNATPKEFADYVDHACNLTKNMATKIQENNFKLLKNFDNKTVAKQYIDLAQGRPTGFYKSLEQGNTSAKLITEGRRDLYEFFEKKKSKSDGIKKFL
jgi:glycosyltransferase involved in cell wall biosynthesis